MGKDKTYSQNYYDVVNKDKYVGKGKPFYRSSYENRMFYYCDHSINVLKWSSESLAIPYVCRIDGKKHRYYPDIIADIRDVNGKVVKYIFEIKPYKQTLPPKEPKTARGRKSKSYIYAKLMYIKNMDKWDATEKYCKKYGYVFEKITEKEIYKRDV
jgi:hypothetical protein